MRSERRQERGIFPSRRQPQTHPDLLAAFFSHRRRGPLTVPLQAAAGDRVVVAVVVGWGRRVNQPGMDHSLTLRTHMVRGSSAQIRPVSPSTRTEKLDIYVITPILL